LGKNRVVNIATSTQIDYKYSLNTFLDNCVIFYVDGIEWGNRQFYVHVIKLKWEKLI